MLKRLLLQVTGLMAWFGLFQGSIALRDVNMGTFNMCRDGY